MDFSKVVGTNNTDKVQWKRIVIAMWSIYITFPSLRNFENCGGKGFQKLFGVGGWELFKSLGIYVQSTDATRLTKL